LFYDAIFTPFTGRAAIGHVCDDVNALDQSQIHHATDPLHSRMNESNPMSSFKDITDMFAVSPQLTLNDLEVAAREGFVRVVCNRPDGEDIGQPSVEQIAQSCASHGLSFVHIPISGGVNEAQIDAMSQALETAAGPVLAYCRSGTRSTNLWAMAQARRGANAQGLVEAAAGAGYDLSGLTPMLRSLGS
jgi:uncharacterized protein (TIGR01244 family)